MCESHTNGPRRLNVAAVGLWSMGLAAVMVHLYLPGNVPWINDGPKLITRALEFNAQNRWAPIGLVGSLRIPYGPVPTWFYQTMLSITRHPIEMVVIKTVSTWSITLLSLNYLFSKTSLSRVNLLLLLVSPYLYYYGRHLWDNCFLIPLSAMLLAAYARFLEKRSYYSLTILFLLGSLLLQVHLMAVFLVVPVGMALLAFECRWMASRWKGSLLSVVPAALLLYPYFVQVLSSSPSQKKFRAPWAERWADALSGFSFYSFHRFFEYYNPGYLEYHWLVPFGVTATAISAGVFAVAGAAYALQKAQWGTIEGKLLLVAISSIGVCLLGYIYSGLIHHPHYYNSLAISWFLVCAAGLTWIQQSSLGKVWVGAHLVLMAALLISWIRYIEHTGGTRTVTFGPVLANQLEVVDNYVAYPRGTPVEMQTLTYAKYSRAFTTLDKLRRSPLSDATTEVRVNEGLCIEYAGEAPDARLVLTERKF